MPYKRFLGYQAGKNHLPEIIEDEAVIVRQIYCLFLQGRTPTYIAHYLTRAKIPSPGGKDTWQISTIKSILTNEKYCGSSLLQKTFIEDFLTKKKKVNHGELPKYYIENSHEGIVSKTVFNLVQEEFKRRKQISNPQYSGIYCFSSRIVCGNCGSYYGKKVWHSNSKYRSPVWQCNHRYEQEQKCKTPHLYEHTIMQGFSRIIYKHVISHPEIISICQSIIFSSLRDKGKSAEKPSIEDRKNYISLFFSSIQALNLEIPFDEMLWNIIVDRVVCTSKNELVYFLKDNSHYAWPIIGNTPTSEKAR